MFFIWLFSLVIRTITLIFIFYNYNIILYFELNTLFENYFWLTLNFFWSISPLYKLVLIVFAEFVLGWGV